MKKEAVFFIVLLFFVPLILSDEQSQFDSAYSCVLNKINISGCGGLSLEDKTFVLFSTGNCRESLLNSYNGTCFTKNGLCDLKLTSQAITALTVNGDDISNYTSWILNQKSTSNNLEWFLQVDSPATSNCTINSYAVVLNANKTLFSSQSSSCFSITSDGYWIKISPSCYSNEINISCTSQFSTTLFFKKSGSTVIHLFDKTKSSFSGGTIKEKVKASCFNFLGSCNYEDSLWASVALDLSGKETSDYIPYLIAFSEENLRYTPYSFLSYLTNSDEFSNLLFLMQNPAGYWNVSNNSYYDTALALLFSENSSEKQFAKNWLLSTQNSNGCWNSQSVSSLRDTAFILSSIWTGYSLSETCGNNFINLNEECDGNKLGGNTCKEIFENSTGTLSCYPPGDGYECQFDTSLCVGGTPECTSNTDCYGDLICFGERCIEPPIGNVSNNTQPLPNCESEGYFCISEFSCSEIGGNPLESYSCTGNFKSCCDRGEFSCSDSGGEICTSDEICTGTIQNEDCCVEGECALPTPADSCESDYDCSSKEECLSGLCTKKDVSKNKNLLIISLILVILIAIVILLIKFKDKLFKKKDSKRNIFFRGGLQGPRMPPRMPPRILPRNFLQKPIQRKPITPGKSYPPQKIIPKKDDREDVLKKLREMGK